MWFVIVNDMDNIAHPSPLKYQMVHPFSLLLNDVQAHTERASVKLLETNV